METILLKRKQYNIDHDILLNSENVCIDSLLDRATEMRPVYQELAATLDENQQILLWDGLLRAATHWNPDNSRELRDTRKALTQLNRDIEGLAVKLAALVRQRHEIAESSGLSSYNDCHVVQWIDRAGAGNRNYQGYVQEPLNLLAAQFDLKYWPRTMDVLDAIADFAKEAEVEVNDDWTEELLSSSKWSKSDYVRVLLKAIEESKTAGPLTHRVPENFRITDKSIASIINCTLNLGVDELVSDEYVKRARQNIRAQNK